MTLRAACCALMSGYFVLVVVSARAANPVTWQVSLSTTGGDVFWTSPTAIDLGFPEYDWSFEITKLNANVLLFGDQNLLDELEATSGSGAGSTLPLVVVDDVIQESFTGSSAHIRIEVDSQGFGRGSGTDITLGRVLGLPIRRVDFEATIRVVGIPTGDYDRNGTVNGADYHVWSNTLGSSADLRADGNHNGVVDAGDYTLWRDNFASGGGAGGVEVTAVPEPGTAWLITLAVVLAGFVGSRRVR